MPIKRFFFLLERKMLLWHTLYARWDSAAIINSPIVLLFPIIFISSIFSHWACDALQAITEKIVMNKLFMKLVTVIFPKAKREMIRTILLQGTSDRMADSRLYTPVMPLPFTEGELSDLYSLFLNNTDEDLFKWHHYFPIYHKHFSRYRNRPVTIFEVGVFRGGSLKLWKKYFGDQAQIHGLDIDPECMRFHNPDAGIHIHIGDQSDAGFLRDLMNRIPRIDIFIDDGGHTTNQQITTFVECYDKVALDGVYLCEDLHSNYDPRFVDCGETFIEFAKKHIDLLYAWYPERSYSDYFVRDAEPKPVPAFTSMTAGISFYDSIVVFEKSPVCVPCAEIR